MAIVNQMLLQNYSNALNIIDTLETGQKKALADLKSLKEGELSLDDLVVTDNGWEFRPPPPELPTSTASTNGAKAKEPAGAGSA